MVAQMLQFLKSLKYSKSATVLYGSAVLCRHKSRSFPLHPVLYGLIFLSLEILPHIPKSCVLIASLLVCPEDVLKASV